MKKKNRKYYRTARNKLLLVVTIREKKTRRKIDGKRINNTQEGSANEPTHDVSAKRSTDDWVAGPY